MIGNGVDVGVQKLNKSNGVEFNILYWNGHNLFVHQLLGLYLRVGGMAVQFTSDVIRTIVVRRRHRLCYYVRRRRHRLALLRNT